MTIGELSRATGVAIETVRFYERIGLLPRPKRRPSGFREYTDEDVRRLRFVRRAKLVGFSLREIEELLRLRVDPASTCEQVRRKALAKVQKLEERIRELERIRSALMILAGSCQERSPQEECPILAALEAVDLADRSAESS